MPCRLLLLLLLPALLSLPASAQTQLRVTGELRVDGEPWSGSGRFRFALIDDRGRQLWRSHKQNAFTGETGALRLQVQDGRYQITLGDPATGMQPLPATVAATNPLSLRVWFSDGAKPLEPIAPDQPVHLRTAAVQSPDSVSLADVVYELRQIRAELFQLRRDSEPARPGTPHQHDHRPPETQAATIPLTERPAIGSPNAPLVLVEFTDYDCGFCKRFDEAIFPDLKKRYIDTGKLRFISYNLPLDMHPQTRKTAEYLLCAWNQDSESFPEMRRRAFAGSALSHDQLTAMAAEAGLDTDALNACIEAGEAARNVDGDVAIAHAAGIRGTPTFVLGKVEQGRITGEKISGAPSAAFFAAKLDALLKDAPAKQ